MLEEKEKERESEHDLYGCFYLERVLSGHSDLIKRAPLFFLSRLRSNKDNLFLILTPHILLVWLSIG